MKQRIDISVKNRQGIRVNPDLILGEYNGYRSGDMLDANSVIEVVKLAMIMIVGTAPEELNDFGEIVAALLEKADKSNTLKGYGIDDTYTKSEIDTKLSDVTGNIENPENYADDEDIDNMFGKGVNN